jgi:hypothetical protein
MGMTEEDSVKKWIGFINDSVRNAYLQMPIISCSAYRAPSFLLLKLSSSTARNCPNEDTL